MAQQDLRASLCLLLFYLAGAGLIAGASWLAPVFHQEGARKAYHLVASGSVFILLYCFSSWYAALLGMTALLIIAFVVIGLAARTRLLASISIARVLRYEILRQILYFQATIAVLLIVFWGILGAEYRYLAAAGAIAWGLGDSSAAIIGKRYGRRKLRLWGLDHQKTVAGSSAMFAASTLGILAVLGILRGGPWGLLILASLTLGLIATAVEAVSKGGSDTITLPFSVAIAGLGVLALLSRLWGVLWP